LVSLGLSAAVAKVFCTKSESRNISVVAWGVHNFKDFTILSFEIFSSHSRLSQQLPEKENLHNNKIPPLMRGLSKVNRQTGMSATTTLSPNESNWGGRVSCLGFFVYLFCGINDLEGFYCSHKTVSETCLNTFK
jgi:hypothetical protein